MRISDWSSDVCSSDLEVVWTGGDVHLYLNHAELVEQQLRRVPEGAPKLRILRRPASIFAYRFEDFTVEDYAPQAHISAPVAVLRAPLHRSEEQTSELPSLMRNSYAVFRFKKKQ